MDTQKWIREHPVRAMIIGVITAITADMVVDELAAPIAHGRHRDEMRRLDSTVVRLGKLIVETNQSNQALEEIEESLDSLLTLLNAEGHRF